jgi:fructose-1,6-bisphosphatase I
VTGTTLASYLASTSAPDSVARTVLAVTSACGELSRLIASGNIETELAAVCGGNFQGEEQKQLDVIANAVLIDAARTAPVAWVLSEELEAPVLLDASQPIALAIDPLDGSSNIETNAAIGTIFSLLPTADGVSFFQPGSRQLAAGYVIYGPQTLLALTLGNGTMIFTLDAAAGEFILTAEADIRPETAEFAINASNYRHWDAGIRQYVDECLEGAEGPRAKNFNMRWLAALVGEAHRILVRGGVFLYPCDRRKGYGHGRLRLIYEANPIALLVEQAGGSATDGLTRILNLEPASHHQRVGLVFGANEEVAIIGDWLVAPGERPAPLFSQRGLFQV